MVTIETIIKSANHYLAAVKGNQPQVYQAVQNQFGEDKSRIRTLPNVSSG